MDLFEEEELKFKTNRILDESHNLFTTTSSLILNIYFEFVQYSEIHLKLFIILVVKLLYESKKLLICMMSL